MTDTAPDAYYEGVAAERDTPCPYSKADLFHFCWWMAGYHDAQRGMT